MPGIKCTCVMLVISYTFFAFLKTGSVMSFTSKWNMTYLEYYYCWVSLLFWHCGQVPHSHPLNGHCNNTKCVDARTMTFKTTWFQTFIKVIIELLIKQKAPFHRSSLDKCQYLYYLPPPVFSSFSISSDAKVHTTTAVILKNWTL